MREHYFGHFVDSEKDIKEIWKDAHFVFDTNVLFDLYRYSEATKDDFLRLFDKIKERSWLPEQAAYEFFNGRRQEISTQSSKYESTNRKISELKKAFNERREHPFISEEKLSDLTRVLDEVKKELGQNRKTYQSKIDEDDIVEHLAKIFDTRVGEPYSSKKLEEIFKDGEIRYKNRIPPGFEDRSKVKEVNSEKDGRKKFGDLIIWMQTMDFSKLKGTSIIFVSQDAKPDWRLGEDGKALPELLTEFASTTGYKFLMYSPDHFLRDANERLNSNVSDATIKEVERAEAARAIKRASKLINQSQLKLARRSLKHALALSAGGLPVDLDLHLFNTSDDEDSAKNKRDALLAELYARMQRNTEMHEKLEEEFSLLQLVDGDEDEIEIVRNGIRELQVEKRQIARDMSRALNENDVASISEE